MVLALKRSALISIAPFTPSANAWGDQRLRKNAAELLGCGLRVFHKHTRLSLLSLLQPATKLRQGNVFTPVCNSVHRGVSVPACTTGHITRGSLSRGTSVQGSLSRGSLSRESLGGLCLGVSVQEVSVQGVSIQGVSVQGSFSRGSLSVGSLSRGVSVQWISVQGGLCREVSVRAD